MSHSCLARWKGLISVNRLADRRRRVGLPIPPRQGRVDNDLQTMQLTMRWGPGEAKGRGLDGRTGERYADYFPDTSG